jgi:DNA-binding SARP family transcriptional activator
LMPTAVAPSPGGAVRLEILGGFGVSREGREIAIPPSAQRVLAFVCLQERPLQRAYVAGLLWLDTPEERATANLRSALWRLRVAGRNLVQTGRSHLMLSPDVTVDVWEARAFARDVLRHDVDCRDPGDWEMRLGGDLLPQWYEDWVLVERERFRQLRLHALESLCEQLLTVGRHALAIDAALAAIAAEPLRESAHRAYIRVHLAEGNRSGALHAYERFRRMLREELGVEPSDQMRELVSSLGARAS